MTDIKSMTKDELKNEPNWEKPFPGKADLQLVT